jgi:hypothetical protein
MSIRKTLPMIGLLLARGALAATAPEEANYCHDPAVDAQWERMLGETPEDPIVLKLYGLRSGLCSMVDHGKISLNQATEIWERERAESVVQRYREESGKKRRFAM